ncbi:DUF4886 domain-containing protein [Gramella sp. BOM4]|nr:DUF4886 domain-containing protein [Christiangramia bathymodioli]
MKNILFLLLFLSLASCNSEIKKKAEPMHVLLIGNSLTYYNDMPQMLQEMLEETDRNIIVEQATHPGFSLEAHLDNIILESSKDQISTRKKSGEEKTETEKKILEKDWDIIVLQTGGVRIMVPEVRNQKVDLAIKQVKELSHPDTKFYLFQTWVTQVEYPREFCYPAFFINPESDIDDKICSAKLNNEKDYFNGLQKGYKELSKNNNLALTQHGEIYRKLSLEHPEIDLLEDSMHPSRKGAFLSACILYRQLTDKDPVNLEYTAGIDPVIGKSLKKAAS